MPSPQPLAWSRSLAPVQDTIAGALTTRIAAGNLGHRAGLTVRPGTIIRAEHLRGAPVTAFPTLPGRTSKWRNPNMPLPHHTISANGIKRRYVEAGSDPPVILLRGFSETW